MEKYERIRLVGRGAHGTVYLCARKSDNQNVIVKQIPVDSMTTSERQSALGEVKILQMLSHPNIIGYFENFLEENALCIVMQYAQGGTLADYLSERHGCLLEEERILSFFAQILISLHHLHRRQILHRDLKCQNILLNKKQNVCKLSDFGISKTLLTGKSKASTVVGTPNYLSPELCDARGFNMKSDIWALGCVLYELCALKRAFQADTLPALIMKIMKGHYDPISDHYSEALKKLVDQLLNLDPEKRPTTADLIAMPVLVAPVLSQIMDAGSLPSGPKAHRSLTPRTKHKLNTQKSSPDMAAALLAHQHTSRPDQKIPYRYQVYSFGGSLGLQPKSVPAPPTQIKLLQAVAGPSRKMAVTHQGRVLVWSNDEEEQDEELFSSSLESYSSGGSRKPQYLRMGPSPITVAKVVCGERMTGFVTDRGMLLTVGSGAEGCLGHGSVRDQSSPKIVKDLICSSVTELVCGSKHVLCLTSDNEVYGWGCSSDGRLGRVDPDSLDDEEEKLILKPFKLKLPPGLLVHSIHACSDASAVVGKDGSVWASGSNKYNKLGLNSGESAGKPDEVWTEFSKSTAFPTVDMLLSQPFGLGWNHSALISGRTVYLSGSPTGDSDVAFFLPRPVVLGSEQSLLPYRIVCGEELTVAVTEGGEIWSIRPRARFEHGEEVMKVGPEAELVQLPNTESHHEIVSLSAFRDTALICVKSL